MKILAISHKYPPSIGGMQKQSFELISGLSNHTTVLPFVFKSNYPHALFFLFTLPSVFWILLTDKKITHVHANDGLMALFISPFLLFKRVKFMVTIHGLDIVMPVPLYQWWIKKVLSNFHLIIAVSEQTKAECIKRGLPMNKVLFIPNGFEPNKIVIESSKITENKTKILLTIGRPIPRKGFSWFANEVLPFLNSDVLFVIVGPKDPHLPTILKLQKILPKSIFNILSLLGGFSLDEIALAHAAQNPDLSSKIRFLGKLPQNELDKLRKEAYLFVMPNIHVPGDYEGFGLVALEAVSSGLLCLAADTDGIPSAIKNNKTGILLPSGQAKYWIEKINYLLENPSITKQLSSEYHVNITNESFNWNQMAKSYFEAFQEIK